MQTTTHPVALSARLAIRSTVRLAVLQLVLGVSEIIFWWLTRADRGPGLLVAGVLLIVAALLSAVPVIRASKAEALRIDDTGITVRGADTVPWSALAEVVVELPPSLWRQIVLGPRWLVFAFIPRAGVEVPGPLSISDRPTTCFRQTRQRLFGTNMTVAPVTLTASSEEILAAVEAFSDLPVRHRTDATTMRGLRRTRLLVLTLVPLSLVLVALLIGFLLAR